MIQTPLQGIYRRHPLPHPHPVPTSYHYVFPHLFPLLHLHRCDAQRNPTLSGMSSTPIPIRRQPLLLHLHQVLGRVAGTGAGGSDADAAVGGEAWCWCGEGERSKEEREGREDG